VPRQQEIAGEAVLDAHHVAHLAEPGDAFEQNHFHLDFSLAAAAMAPAQTMPRWIVISGSHQRIT
jgi:hypothetical protein